MFLFNIKNDALTLVMFIFAMVFIFACSRPSETSLSEAEGGNHFQLLDASRLSAYKSLLPKVSFPKLQSILNDERTLWYDKSVMAGVYQDTVAPEVTTGLRYNSDGKRLIVPEGKKLFTADGKEWAFPFSVTAGTDFSDNAGVVDFVWLPQGENGTLPIAYWISNPNNGSLKVVRWNWMYPIGTVFGEVIFTVDRSSNSWLVSEIRTRTRYASAWATNVFRPFPTSQSLADAIKEKKPNWKKDSELNRFVTHLENPATLTARNLSSKAAFPGVFEQNGALDFLPELSDKELIKSLVKETTFESSYGEVWKEGNGLKTFAASTQASFSFVPKNFDAGLLEVNEDSCKRCHQDAGKPVAQFVSRAVLYGDVWGQDQIFSMHIWDQSKHNGAGKENRAVNPQLEQNGLVKKYSPTLHTPKYYQVAPVNYKVDYSF